MKFTPDTLLQIYLDGSFTEEAQAEFDKLVRKDPVFAERVTQAVAERVGPLPEAPLSAIESNLDAKMTGVWNKYKPSPLRQTLSLVGGAAVLALGLTGLYFGASHLWTVYHQGILPGNSGDRTSTEQEVSGSASAAPSSTGEPTGASKPALAKAKSHKTTMAPASSAKGKPVSASPDPSMASQDPSRTLGQNLPNNGAVKASVVAATGNPAVPGAAQPVRSTVVGNQQAVSGQAQFLPPPPGMPALSSPAGHRTTQEGNALRVSIETQKTQNVVVNVLDSNGILIRRLYQGAWEPGNHVVDWDGKDEAANPVLPGDYTVVVNADGKTMSGVVTVKPNQ